MGKNKEFCIMPSNMPYWDNKRFNGAERHEIWEGRTGNRKKSIEDGLVIFTSPELHRIGKFSIHLSPKKWEEETKMKKISVEIWCKYYNKTEEDFRERYGKLPL